MRKVKATISHPVDSEPEDYSAHDLSGSAERLTIPDSLSGLRADAALAALMPEYSRSRIQSWLKARLVTVDGVAADPKRKVWAGETVIILTPPDPTELACEPEDMPLQVVFEDAEILVLDKPAGLVVHPGSGNWSGTLMNGLLHYLPGARAVPRAGIVHRLDKDTSGLLVVAKSVQAQLDLVRQLQARSVKREYLALVWGSPPDQGTVDAPIDRHPSVRTRMAVVAGGREARTHFESRERFGDCALVACSLETGRTHQIRVHLAHLGHPLVGDPVYGRKRAARPMLAQFPRQALHARRLGLTHPASGERLHWEVALPEDFAGLLKSLRESGS